MHDEIQQCYFIIAKAKRKEKKKRRHKVNVCTKNSLVKEIHFYLKGHVTCIKQGEIIKKFKKCRHKRNSFAQLATKFKTFLEVS